MKTILSLVTLAAMLLTTAGCFTFERTGPSRVVVTETPAVTTTRTVTVLPSGYRTRVYRGTTYYYSGNVYYRSAPGGYVVVDRPVWW